MPEDDYRLASYDYALPPELVAQAPLAARDASRLLVLDRSTGGVEHGRFTELPERLRAGDLLVTNRSRVFPARLLGRRERGGKAEILLVRRRGGGVWDAMLRPGRRLRAGMSVLVGPGLRVLVEPDAVHESLPEHAPPGAETVVRAVRLLADGMSEDEALERFGHAPLPPYIRREPGDARREMDRQRYQTVFARVPGASAAPTAGLHFTPELLAGLAERGVESAFVTLHVGLGTFLPVREDDVARHRMHDEAYAIPQVTVAAIEACRGRSGRVVAVGTTVTRVLESIASAPEGLRAASGRTSLFIHPGFRFRAVDALVTNFHLPRSTLLMLVCAFAGRDRVLAAYREALREGYRFASYGDAMLVSAA